MHGKNRQLASRGVRVLANAQDGHSATEALREENARRASQAVTRLFRDVRCSGFFPMDELSSADVPDEPMFDLGRSQFAYAGRRSD